MRPRISLALLAALALFVPGVARAQAPYKIQPLARLGEMAGDTVVPSGGGYQFWLGSLSDTGQLSIAVGTQSSSKPEMLLQYAGTQFTTIVAAGREAPSGTWPANVTINWPISMNRSGNILFTANSSGITPMGTFLTITKVGLNSPPAINSKGQIALAVQIDNGPQTVVLLTP